MSAVMDALGVLFFIDFDSFLGRIRKRYEVRNTNHKFILTKAALVSQANYKVFEETSFAKNKVRTHSFHLYSTLLCSDFDV